MILSDAAQKILKGQLEGHRSALVFPGPDDRPYSREQVGKVFRRAATAAGLKDFRTSNVTVEAWRLGLMRRPVSL